MTDATRSGDDEAFARELAGDRPADAEAAYFREDTVESRGALTDTEMYEGELESGSLDDVSGGGAPDGLELLTELELRGDETDDPNVAAEEGMTWVPPVDPPVVPSDDPQGISVAAGFGVSALEEPYDDDHRSEPLSAEGDLNDRIREAIRADAATSRFADVIVIGVRDGTVVLRGMVDDIDDTDNVAAVVERVSGVDEVIDEIEVSALL